MKKNRMVFLIDDDLDDQEIFGLALAELGDDTILITAKNGIEALTMLQENTFKPNYIFLDLNMPRMNGKQCLQEIKRHTSLTDIPVIIYSTSAEKRDIEETKALGAAAFITKPAEIRELVNSIHNVFLQFQ